MPKRKHGDKENYIRRKMKKLEKKLKKRIKRTISTDSNESSDDYSLPIHAGMISEEISNVEDPLPILDVEDTAVVEVPPTSSPPILRQGIQAEELQSLPQQPAENLPELDENILSLLGDIPCKEKQYGPSIQKDLALRFEHIAVYGLSNENKKELMEKYAAPTNCNKIDPPLLNPELKSALTDTLIKKDKALERKQKEITAAISSLSQALTLIFGQENKDPNIIKHLIEAGRLMCDIQHGESMTRRSFICSTIRKDVKDHLYDTKIDKFLFGEQLAETLKVAKAINKSGAEIKNTPKITIPSRNQKATNLNYKPQLTPNSRAAPAMRRQDPNPGTSSRRFAQLPAPRFPPPPPPQPPLPPRYSQRAGQPRQRR